MQEQKIPLLKIKLLVKSVNKNYRDIWREIKNSSNSNVKLPNIVDKVCGSQNIWYVARTL